MHTHHHWFVAFCDPISSLVIDRWSSSEASISRYKLNGIPFTTRMLTAHDSLIMALCSIVSSPDSSPCRETSGCRFKFLGAEPLLNSWLLHIPQYDENVMKLNMMRMWWNSIWWECDETQYDENVMKLEWTSSILMELLSFIPWEQLWISSDLTFWWTVDPITDYVHR